MSRLIDADELLNFIQMLPIDLGRREVEDIMAHIREMPKIESEQQWVPCSERLPENKQRCLLTTLLNGMKYVYVGTYATDLYSANKHDFADKKGVSGWYYRDSEYGYIEYDNVTAWMPLPEPYEPEG